MTANGISTEPTTTVETYKKKIKDCSRQLLKEAEERGKESAEFDLNKLQEMTYRNEAKSEVIASIREEIKNALKEVHGGGNGRRLLMTLLFKLDELSK